MEKYLPIFRGDEIQLDKKLEKITYFWSTKMYIMIFFHCSIADCQDFPMQLFPRALKMKECPFP